MRYIDLRSYIRLVLYYICQTTSCQFRETQKALTPFLL